MLSTDLFWSNLKSTDLVVITEEQKDFPTSGNTTPRPHPLWCLHDSSILCL